MPVLSVQASPERIDVVRKKGLVDASIGGVDGGSRCRMSIIRKGNVALSNLRNSPVALSNLRNSPVALSNLRNSPVACR